MGAPDTRPCPGLRRFDAPVTLTPTLHGRGRGSDKRRVPVDRSRSRWSRCAGDASAFAPHFPPERDCDDVCRRVRCMCSLGRRRGSRRCVSSAWGGFDLLSVFGVESWGALLQTRHANAHPTKGSARSTYHKDTYPCISRTNMHAPTHARTRTHIDTNAHELTRVLAHGRMHPPTHTHTHPHTHTLTHTYTHTHIHTHGSALMIVILCWCGFISPSFRLRGTQGLTDKQMDGWTDG